MIFALVMAPLKCELLVMPSTNANSKRSFSALHLVKSYLRSTMSQQRLNHLMIMHVYKDHTDQLSLVDTANEFVRGHEHSESIFGKFQIVTYHNVLLLLLSLSVSLTCVVFCMCVFQILV